MEYLLYSFAFSVALYLSGTFILHILKVPTGSGHQKLFIHTFTGLAAFVFLFAAGRTAGNTIFVIFPLLGIGSYLSFKWEAGPLITKRRFTGLARVPVAIAVEFLLVATGVFILHYYFIFLKSSYTYPAIFSSADRMFYANVAEYLSATGIETYNFDYLNISENSPAPYHYFEIWLNSGVQFLTGRQSYLTQELICLPITAALIYTGIAAILERYFSINYWIRILGIGFLFFSGLHFSADSGFILFEDLGEFTYNCFYLPRSHTVYIFLIAFLLSVIFKRYNTALCILVGLGICSAAALPGLALSCAAIIAFSFSGKSQYRIKPGTILFIALSGISYAAFYKLNSNKYPIIIPPGPGDLFAIHTSPGGLTIFRNIIAKTILQISLIYSPLLILMLINWTWLKEKFSGSQFLVVFTITAFIFSLLCWAFFNPMPGSVGMFSILTIALLNTVLFLFAAMAISNINKPHLRIIGGSLFALWILQGAWHTVQRYNAYNTADEYSNEYINAVADEVRPLGNLTAYDGNVGNTILYKNPLSHPPRYYLGTIIPNSSCAALFMLDFPLSNDPVTRRLESNFIASSPFGRFVNKQKTEGKFASADQSKLDFLNAYHIRYFFVSKNKEIPGLFSSSIKKIITDKKSGERCVILL